MPVPGRVIVFVALRPFESVSSSSLIHFWGGGAYHKARINPSASWKEGGERKRGKKTFFNPPIIIVVCVKPSLLVFARRTIFFFRSRPLR